jgi:hypothetical protein
VGYEGAKRHRLGLRQNLPESSEIPEPTALNRLANKGHERSGVDTQGPSALSVVANKSY